MYNLHTILHRSKRAKKKESFKKDTSNILRNHCLIDYSALTIVQAALTDLLVNPPVGKLGADVEYE